MPFEDEDRAPNLPRLMPCYECGGFDGITAPEREVIKLGPVVNAADPTQTYELVCGHRAMAS